jgi:sterol desaturase/sphingolipid hydroxylase (fatty acid hydroxylase superfamily)
MDELLGLLKYLFTGLALYGIFALIERIRPAERGQSAGSVWFNLQWYVIYTLLAIGMVQLGLGTVVERLQHLTGAPLIRINALDQTWQYVLAALGHFLLVDFFYYWFHRGQHQMSFLWEQHKFHHSETALNVTSTRRVHWLEEPLVVLFVGIPIGLLVRVEGLEMGILSFIEVLWLQFVHLNLRLELGWLGRVIVGPQHHRLHHSYQPEHIDRNFAVFFPLWDMIFGTYYVARSGEFPPTGLASQENYNDLRLAFILPFQAWWKMTQPQAKSQAKPERKPSIR